MIHFIKSISVFFITAIITHVLLILGCRSLNTDPIPPLVFVWDLVIALLATFGYGIERKD
jgi:hypothetical protein